MTVTFHDELGHHLPPPTRREQWDAWLREAEDAYDLAMEAVEDAGSYDHAIAHVLPALNERLRSAKARLQERLTAYIAFVEATR